MRSIISAKPFICSLTLSLLLTLSASSAFAQAPRLMQHDFQKAMAAARENNIPVLLHFYTDWCGPCRRMDQTVFSSPQLEPQMGGKIVLLKVNGDQAADLARNYGVDSYPTDVFIDANGRMLAKLVGMASFQEFVRSGLEVADRYQKSQALVEARKNAGNDPAPTSMWKIHLGEEGELPTASPVSTQEKLEERQQEALVEEPQSRKADEPEVVFLALDGFCPVSLHTRRDWVKGAETWASIFKKQRYQFAGQAEKDQFDADPIRFAPRLLGCDPVIIWESDRALPGTTEFAAYYNDELYLFTSEENRRLFELDPERYTNTRHVLRPADVEATLIR